MVSAPTLRCLLPTVWMTVTRRPNDRAISTVRSVQLSATITIRSGRRVCLSSAVIVRPIVSSSLWAGTTTQTVPVAGRTWRWRMRCSASEAFW